MKLPLPEGTQLHAAAITEHAEAGPNLVVSGDEPNSPTTVFFGRAHSP